MSGGAGELGRREALWAAAAASLGALMPRLASAQDAVRVAIFDGLGVSASALSGALSAVGSSDLLRGEPVTAAQIRSGALGAHDVALFTGGRGSLQGRDLGEVGRDAVRSAVAGGLGYVGICGGAFLALQGEAEFFKLGMVAARHATGDSWMRGIGPAELLPSDGSPPATLHYANGPIFAIESVEGLAPPSPLATFGTEYALPEHGTRVGEMMGRPAILSARHGAGRIVLFSPNPTLPPERPELLVRALTRTGRRTGVPLDTWAAAFR